ncbi:unnamed protein product, partial [Amoebophrya sp. A120]
KAHTPTIGNLNLSQLVLLASCLRFSNKDAFPKQKFAELRDVVMKNLLRRRRELLERGLFVEAMLNLGGMYARVNAARSRSGRSGTAKSSRASSSASNSLNLRTRNLITRTILEDFFHDDILNEQSGEACHAVSPQLQGIADLRRLPLACAACQIQEEEVFEKWWKQIAAIAARTKERLRKMKKGVVEEMPSRDLQGITASASASCRRKSEDSAGNSTDVEVLQRV